MPAAAHQPPTAPGALRACNLPLLLRTIAIRPASAATPRAGTIVLPSGQTKPNSLREVPPRHRPCGFGLVHPPAPNPPIGLTRPPLHLPSRFSCLKATPSTVGLQGSAHPGFKPADRQS